MEKMLDAALVAVQMGREVLVNYYGRLEHIEEKEMAGLVSEADRTSEEVITRHLSSLYPHVEMLGEESAFLGAQVRDGRASSLGRWILDPLDGTTNYIHRFPAFAISLAYEENGVLQFGIIDVPMMGETYVAIKGGGAFLNGRKIQVSKTTSLKKSLLATGFMTDDPVGLEQQFKIFKEILPQTRGIRRPGAAAYHLAMVARGSFEAFWETNLKPWDTAAGQILVEEAGGMLLTYEGTAYDPYQKTIIAGPKEIVVEIQKIIAKVRG